MAKTDQESGHNNLGGSEVALDTTDFQANAARAPFLLPYYSSAGLEC